MSTHIKNHYKGITIIGIMNDQFSGNNNGTPPDITGIMEIGLVILMACTGMDPLII